MKLLLTLICCKSQVNKWHKMIIDIFPISGQFSSIFPTHSLNCKKKKKIRLQNSQVKILSHSSRPNLSVSFVKATSLSSCRAAMSESGRSLHFCVFYIYKLSLLTSFYFPALSKLTSHPMVQPQQNMMHLVHLIFILSLWMWCCFLCLKSYLPLFYPESTCSIQKSIHLFIHSKSYYRTPIMRQIQEGGGGNKVTVLMNFPLQRKKQS